MHHTRYSTSIAIETFIPIRLIVFHSVVLRLKENDDGEEEEEEKEEGVARGNVDILTYVLFWTTQTRT